MAFSSGSGMQIAKQPIELSQRRDYNHYEGQSAMIHDDQRRRIAKDISLGGGGKL